MPNEFAVISYREQVSVAHLNRTTLGLYIRAEVRRRALHRMLDDCLKVRAHFYTPRVLERSVWTDDRGNPCPQEFAQFREFRFELTVEKGSADLR